MDDATRDRVAEVAGEHHCPVACEFEIDLELTVEHEQALVLAIVLGAWSRTSTGMSIVVR